MILSIDADSRRLAYAIIEDGNVRCVRTLERADARGRVREWYESQLTALMRRCGELGIQVFIKGIFCGQNVKGYAPLAEVAGEIKRAARLCAVTAEAPSPQLAKEPGLACRPFPLGDVVGVLSGNSTSSEKEGS